jgi:hypothetical protein
VAGCGIEDMAAKTPGWWRGSSPEAAKRCASSRRALRATIEAIGLLLRQEANRKGAPAEPTREIMIWARFGTIVSEVLSLRLMGWRTRSSSSAGASREESKTMLDDQELDRRDDALEAQLKSMMARPELAQEAFPDEKIRGKIIPLFQHFRTLGKGTPPKQ